MAEHRPGGCVEGGHDGAGEIGREGGGRAVGRRRGELALQLGDADRTAGLPGRARCELRVGLVGQRLGAGRVVEEFAQRAVAQAGEGFPLGDVEAGPGHEGAQGLAALVGIEGHGLSLAFSGNDSEWSIFRNLP